MTATVEAGCTIADLQNQLALRGQRLAVDPLWPDRATVGGVLATNDNGSLRAAFGSLRDLILGVTVALPDGTLARSGGKVVKNVAGYDLPKLMVGALGTLGVITQATFRLHPRPQATKAILGIAPDAATVTRFVLAVQSSSVATSGVEVWFDDNGLVLAPLRVEGSPRATEAQWDILHDLATRHGCFAASFWPVWRERERLFQESPHAAVCRVSFLPAGLAEVVAAVSEAARPGSLAWRACLQGVGTGLLRLEAGDGRRLLEVLPSLREKLHDLGGSLVVLRCPPEVRRQVDAWGDAGDAVALMKRVKHQFDPAGTLNPGRFVGGI
jgi:glycolate oxidase FAD binding subunit